MYCKIKLAITIENLDTVNMYTAFYNIVTNSKSSYVAYTLSNARII